MVPWERGTRSVGERVLTRVTLPLTATILSTKELRHRRYPHLPLRVDEGYELLPSTDIECVNDVGGEGETDC